MSTVTRPRTDVCLIAVIAALAFGDSARAQTTPAAPGALQVTARSESSLSLRWKDRSRSEAYYKVRVSGRVRRLAASRQSVTVSHLQPSVAYRIAVQACSRAGRCSKAVTETATTAAARHVPAPPTPQPEPDTAPASTPTRTVPAPPTAPTTTVGVAGTVTVTTGDCMPTIGDPGNRPNPCRTSPAAGAHVLLFAPALTNADLRAGPYHGPRSPTAQATTDAGGQYQLDVEPGTYSFLVDTGTGPECGLFGADWSACPHTLLAPTQTVDLNVDHAVW